MKHGTTSVIIVKTYWTSTLNTESLNHSATAISNFRVNRDHSYNKSKETRVVTYACRYTSGHYNICNHLCFLTFYNYDP